jgi:hypothetical protein
MTAMVMIDGDLIANIEEFDQFGHHYFIPQLQNLLQFRDVAGYA